VLNAHNKLQLVLIKKYTFKDVKLRHFGKNTGFMAFDENHGFRDPRFSTVPAYM